MADVSNSIGESAYKALRKLMKKYLVILIDGQKIESYITSNMDRKTQKVFTAGLRQLVLVEKLVETLVCMTQFQSILVLLLLVEKKSI